MNSFKDLIINKDKTVIDAMKQLDKTAKKIVFVVDEKNKLVGSLTDGDIRRWILKKGSLGGKVKDVCRQDTYFVYSGYNLKEARREALRREITYVPVVNGDGTIVEILSIDKEKTTKIYSTEELKLPVVIMAGGRGTRLDPFTRILPKPLIPINDKSLLENIMERFAQFGVKDFYISLNYKSYIIKSYLAELNLPYNIRYIEENKPLGTAGSLYFLKDQIESDLIITNCDILIEADYLDIAKHHHRYGNDITIVTSVKHYQLPYGICEIKEEGELLNMKEKPELSFLVNTGMYVVKREILDLIPEERMFHMTDLINKAKEVGKKVRVYPLNESSWIDVGEWREYNEALRRLNL